MLVEDVPPAWIRLAWFIWGALWGSFFNVAIHRWPREMSVVSPPSHCPACGAPIPAWRNLPIVAYLLQRGRAACCGARLTLRYLVVEVLSALLALAVSERFIVGSPGSRPLLDAGMEALVYFAFVGGLVVATFVDLEHMQIPDEVSLGGAALGLSTVALRSDVDLESIAVGSGAAYLFTMLVPVWAWERWTGQRGMGEGDAKLLMCIGAFLGWQGVLFVAVAASLQGTLGYLAQLAWRTRREPNASALSPPESDVDIVEGRGESEATAMVDVDLPGVVNAHARRDEAGVTVVLRYAPEFGEPSAPHIRFGPFLSLAALEFLFFGNRIVTWYLDSFVEAG